ncbi:PilZ domain-containing protein [Novosphingobium sp.]|uniref:PilZ domain-containing protein n=1 Tax=Novosphingobium sp. TaxID=1874826 RepID=UPI003B52D8A2
MERKHDTAQAASERRIRKRQDLAPASNANAVRLVDLSTHGCCLHFAAAIEYRPGQFIRLGFTGETEAIRAIVRWTNSDRVGAEFTSDLSDARVKAILGQGAAPMVGLL